MIQHPLERPSTLMLAQRMSNIARNILHVQRTAPVALLVEQDLHQTKELLVNAIRNGVIVRVPESQLTDSERRQAYHNLFDPCQYE